MGCFLLLHYFFGRGWVAEAMWRLVAEAIPARDSLLGLSLAKLPKIVVYLSCSAGHTHFARTNSKVRSQKPNNICNIYIEAELEIKRMEEEKVP
jgi:hypothetical protein